MRLAQAEEQHIRDLDARLDEVERELSEMRLSRAPDAAQLRRIELELDEVRLAERRLVEDNRRLASERERARRAGARYRALFVDGDEAVVVTDLGGFIVEANRAATELVGRGHGELDRLPVAAILAGEGRTRVPELLERVREEGRISDVPLEVRSGAATQDVLACICLVGDEPDAIAWHLSDVTLAGGAVAQAEYQRRMRQSRAALEHASAARDEFLGLVSHELKTPVAVIAGNADVLVRRDDGLEPELRRAALEDIRSEAARLQRTIDNLLALARLERGQQIGRAPVDVGEVIRERVQQHREERPGRDVSLAIARGLPPVDASRAYVSQVLRNLIAHAEQHSPAGEGIELSAAVTNAGGAPGVVVKVADRGPAVPDDEIELLFAVASSSGTRPSSRPDPGLGLGLAITRRLVEEQRGRLWAERREGDGMTFSIWLPVRTAP
jgi:PAS domain S-box-containing protein